MPAFIFIILLLLANSWFHHSEDKQAVDIPSYTATYSSGIYSNHRSISRDDALDQYWDEIKEHINGTETIEVHSHESGNNYDLDADLSNGEVESIHFPNGGWIYINADLDSDGSGEGYGSDDYWDVQVDSEVIDNAVDQWASDNGYTLTD
jgi:hypothetical protein